MESATSAVDSGRRGVAVDRLFSKNACASVQTKSPSLAAAHQTGRAIFPHSVFSQDHMIEKGEFKEPGIRTETQFREHVNNVIENPGKILYYVDGRSVYLQESTRTVVFRNPTGSGQSTAFQPENWNTYISKLSKKQPRNGEYPWAK